MSLKAYHTLPIRRHIFDKLHNVRDLGGYITPNGMTAWGRVFRSGRLFDPSEQDLKQLDALRIHTVIDLRTQREIDKHPDVILDGTQHQHVSFISSKLLKDQNVGVGQMYSSILTTSITSIKRAMELIAEGLKDGQAVLFHCTIGKDRTGVLAALLLLLCGVDTTDIIADYQTSRTYLEAFYAQEFSDLPPEDASFLDSSPDFIMEVLDFIQQRGGVRNYLTEIGVSQQVMDELIAQLTVPLPTLED